MFFMILRATCLNMLSTGNPIYFFQLASGMISSTASHISVDQIFKSGRVLELDGINTEISEQVNGYLQCVKYTASHLSQEHFMFFMQFFLYLLNKDKSQTFKKQAAIAIAGQM